MELTEKILENIETPSLPQAEPLSPALSQCNWNLEQVAPLLQDDLSALTAHWALSAAEETTLLSQARHLTTQNSRDGFEQALTALPPLDELTTSQQEQFLSWCRTLPDRYAVYRIAAESGLTELLAVEEHRPALLQLASNFEFAQKRNLLDQLLDRSLPSLGVNDVDSAKALELKVSLIDFCSHYLSEGIETGIQGLPLILEENSTEPLVKQIEAQLGQPEVLAAVVAQFPELLHKLPLNPIEFVFPSIPLHDSTPSQPAPDLTPDERSALADSLAQLLRPGRSLFNYQREPFYALTKFVQQGGASTPPPPQVESTLSRAAAYSQGWFRTLTPGEAVTALQTRSTGMTQIMVSPREGLRDLVDSCIDKAGAYDSTTGVKFSHNGIEVESVLWIGPEDSLGRVLFINEEELVGSETSTRSILQAQRMATSLTSLSTLHAQEAEALTSLMNHLGLNPAQPQNALAREITPNTSAPLVCSYITPATPRGYLELPTGTGKTVVLAHAISALATKTVVVLPINELKESTAVEFKTHAPELTVAEYTTASESWQEADVILMSYAALRDSGWDRLPEAGIELLILDEAHVALADVTRSALNEIASMNTPDGGTLPIIGLTATPETGSSKQLQTISSLLPSCIFSNGLLSAIEAGHIATPRLETVSAAALNNLSPPQQVDCILNYLIDEVKSGSLNGRKTLTFTPLKRDAQYMARLLQHEGIAATAFTSDSDSSIVSELQASESYDIVFATAIAHQGINIPGLSAEIFLKPGTSLSGETQKLGRVLRVNPERPGEQPIIRQFTYDSTTERRGRLYLSDIFKRSEFQECARNLRNAGILVQSSAVVVLPSIASLRRLDRENQNLSRQTIVSVSSCAQAAEILPDYPQVGVLISPSGIRPTPSNLMVTHDLGHAQATLAENPEVVALVMRDDRLARGISHGEVPLLQPDNFAAAKRVYQSTHSKTLVITRTAEDAKLLNSLLVEEGLAATTSETEFNKVPEIELFVVPASSTKLAHHLKMVDQCAVVNPPDAIPLAKEFTHSNSGGNRATYLCATHLVDIESLSNQPDEGPIPTQIVPALSASLPSCRYELSTSGKDLTIFNSNADTIDNWIPAEEIDLWRSSCPSAFVLESYALNFDLAFARSSGDGTHPKPYSYFPLETLQAIQQLQQEGTLPSDTWIPATSVTTSASGSQTPVNRLEQILSSPDHAFYEHQLTIGSTRYVTGLVAKVAGATLPDSVERLLKRPLRTAHARRITGDPRLLSASPSLNLIRASLHYSPQSTPESILPQMESTKTANDPISSGRIHFQKGLILEKLLLLSEIATGNTIVPQPLLHNEELGLIFPDYARIVGNTLHFVEVKYGGSSENIQRSLSKALEWVTHQQTDFGNYSFGSYTLTHLIGEEKFQPYFEEGGFLVRSLHDPSSAPFLHNHYSELLALLRNPMLVDDSEHAALVRLSAINDQLEQQLSQRLGVVKATEITTASLVEAARNASDYNRQYLGQESDRLRMLASQPKVTHEPSQNVARFDGYTYDLRNDTITPKSNFLPPLKLSEMGLSRFSRLFKQVPESANLYSDIALQASEALVYEATDEWIVSKDEELIKLWLVCHRELLNKLIPEAFNEPSALDLKDLQRISLNSVASLAPINEILTLWKSIATLDNNYTGIYLSAIATLRKVVPEATPDKVRVESLTARRQSTLVGFQSPSAAVNNFSDWESISPKQRSERLRAVLQKRPVAHLEVHLTLGALSKGLEIQNSDTLCKEVFQLARASLSALPPQQREAIKFTAKNYLAAVTNNYSDTQAKEPLTRLLLNLPYSHYPLLDTKDLWQIYEQSYLTEIEVRIKTSGYNDTMKAKVELLERLYSPKALSDAMNTMKQRSTIPTPAADLASGAGMHPVSQIERVMAHYARHDNHNIEKIVQTWSNYVDEVPSTVTESRRKLGILLCLSPRQIISLPTGLTAKLLEQSDWNVEIALTPEAKAMFVNFLLRLPLSNDLRERMTAFLERSPNQTMQLLKD